MTNILTPTMRYSLGRNSADTIVTKWRHPSGHRQFSSRYPELAHPRPKESCHDNQRLTVASKPKRGGHFLAILSFRSSPPYSSEARACPFSYSNRIYDSYSGDAQNTKILMDIYKTQITALHYHCWVWRLASWPIRDSLFHCSLINSLPIFSFLIGPHEIPLSTLLTNVVSRNWVAL